ncbi:MAG: SDR family oxidoreductase [Hyphomicrobiaceae bacterium]|nr:SDR family oxidoreductase [Hyphomicrobiaceae bacterium]
MHRLAGRIALVTGSGAGIGRAIATLFAREGAHVYVTDVDEGAARTVAADIVAAAGEATALACDVRAPESIRAMLGAVAAGSGRLDILVNNAGLNVRSDFRHMGDDDWLKIRETNLDGAVRLARDALDLLKVSGNASIINISSIMARRGLRQLAAYSVTKGAISALTRALAVEYAPFGVRVNTLAPGFVDTNLTSRFVRNPLVRKALLDQTPLGRFGTPQDIANAALFLASDESAFMTGSELTIDGGMAAGL